MKNRLLFSKMKKRSRTPFRLTTVFVLGIMNPVHVFILIFLMKMAEKLLTIVFVKRVLKNFRIGVL